MTNHISLSHMNPMNIPPGVRSYSGGQWHTRLKLGLRKAPTLRSSVHGGHWSVGLMILKIVELNSGGWLQTFFLFFSPSPFLLGDKGAKLTSDKFPGWKQPSWHWQACEQWQLPQETGAIKLLLLRPAEKVTSWVFVSASAMDNPQFKHEQWALPYFRGKNDPP